MRRRAAPGTVAPSSALTQSGTCDPKATSQHPVRSPAVPPRPPLVVAIAAAIALAVIGVGVGIHATRGTLGTATPPFVMDAGLAVALPWARSGSR